MANYVSLITDDTWKSIWARHQELRLQFPLLENRTPFLPIAEAGFGHPDCWSITFCGIAAGEVQNVDEDLNIAVATMAEEFGGRHQADWRTHQGKHNFWPEIASICAIISEQPDARPLRVGWANILPISESPKPPTQKLAKAQYEIARAVLSDLMVPMCAQVFVGTFGQANFPLHKSFPESDGISEMDGRIWLRTPKSDEPAIVWVNHVESRRRDSTQPTAKDIAEAILHYLRKTP